MKKLLALLLAAAFVCTIGIGCNKDTKTSAKETKVTGEGSTKSTKAESK